MNNECLRTVLLSSSLDGSFFFRSVLLCFIISLLCVGSLISCGVFFVGCWCVSVRMLSFCRASKTLFTRAANECCACLHSFAVDAICFTACCRRHDDGNYDDIDDNDDDDFIAMCVHMYALRFRISRSNAQTVLSVQQTEQLFAIVKQRHPCVCDTHWANQQQAGSMSSSSVTTRRLADLLCWYKFQ